MPDIYLSTAYLPPAEYFAGIMNSTKVFIEGEENYHKQTYRNRCRILASHGPEQLIIPVIKGSLHKTHIREIRIDYTKRWQKVHLGALKSAYNSSPFFLYYFENLEKIILKNHNFLTDLNMELLNEILRILKIDMTPVYTTEFLPLNTVEGDYRFTIDPKTKSFYKQKEYFQVFNNVHGFVPGLSIVDLIFNAGPEAITYI